MQDTDSHVKDAADYKKRKPYFTNKKAQQGWNGNNSLMWFYNIINKGKETANITKLKGPYLLLTPFHKAGVHDPKMTGASGQEMHLYFADKFSKHAKTTPTDTFMLSPEELGALILEKIK